MGPLSIIMLVLAIIAVVAVVCFQIYFYRENREKMHEFKRIFLEEASWEVEYDGTTGFACGIKGEGNATFCSLKDSINNYLYNMRGSVIDFELLKDTVNRHCDACEDEINTQIPIPLYCGLIGTMIGVICGLVPLVFGGGLEGLLGNGQAGGVAQSVRDLLVGVALAMSASVVGIFLTTKNSRRFKGCKSDEEKAKNAFLTWMQANLLPALPLDTSRVIEGLVTNLNNFNQSFAQNAQELGTTLAKVNEVYRSQDEIISEVRQMDVQKMALANVEVLAQLKQCMEAIPACAQQVSTLSQYLTTINAYLDAIGKYTKDLHDFSGKLDEETNRLHVLEEVRDSLRELKGYFERNKDELKKNAADSEAALRDALGALRATASSSMEELKKWLEACSVELTKAAEKGREAAEEQYKLMLEECRKRLAQQSLAMNEAIKEEQQTLEAAAVSMREKMKEQLDQMPTLAEQLNSLSAIPAALERLMTRMEESNNSLVKRLSQATSDMVSKMRSPGPVVVSDPSSQGQYHPSTSEGAVAPIPTWMKWTIVIGVVLCTLATVANAAFGIIHAH